MEGIIKISYYELGFVEECLIKWKEVQGLLLK
jgi:hypothetical protein